MANEWIFLLLVGVFVLAWVGATAYNRRRELKIWFRRVIDAMLAKEPEQPVLSVPSIRPQSAEPTLLSEEDRSERELAALQKRIEERTQVVRDTDLCHHLWGFYKILFRNLNPEMAQITQHGEGWYEVEIKRSRDLDGLVEFDFELQGKNYTISDDEERRGWVENFKYFSMYLRDDSGRCMIEIPMKLRVDSEGRNYAVMSNGPNAFLPGDWVYDFIRIKLKHERKRNLDIRAQKHRERLSEIKDLKDRFGFRK